MSKDVENPQKGLSEDEMDDSNKREKVLEYLWSPEDIRTVLGLLKGRKMKKQRKHD